MMIMIETPFVVEDIQVAPLGAEMELQTQKDFYVRMSIEEMGEELEQYQIEQEELARLQREKEEAAAKAREEEERLRQEAERLKREEEERQRRALLVPTFNPYDITVLSNLSSEQFYQLLGNTGLLDVAWVFAYAEEHYGINALFLAGLTALESSWGTSNKAIHQNNLTGYNIVSDHSSYSFESRADSVLATAKLLATHYVPSDGKYHNGLSVWGVNEKYCAQSDWADKIVSIANRLLNDLK